MKLGKDFFLWFQLIQGIVELFIRIFGEDKDPPKTKVK